MPRHTPLERLALSVGYTVLAGLALILFVWLVDDLLILALGLGTILVLGPVVFVVSLLLSAMLASIVALPLRLFVDTDRWEKIVGVLAFIFWVLLGFLLSVSG